MKRGVDMSILSYWDYNCWDVGGHDDGQELTTKNYVDLKNIFLIID